MTGLEKLLQRKLPAETFQAVKSALDPEDLDYVPRARLDDVIEERDAARAEVRTLKSNAPDVAALNQQLQDLQTQLAGKDTEIQNIKKDYLIQDKLKAAKARNPKAVIALFDQEALKDDLSGLDSEIARLQKSDSYLFEDDNSGAPGGTGIQGAPAGGRKKTEPDSAAYEAVFGGGIY